MTYSFDQAPLAVNNLNDRTHQTQGKLLAELILNNSNNKNVK